MFLFSSFLFLPFPLFLFSSFFFLFFFPFCSRFSFSSLDRGCYVLVAADRYYRLNELHYVRSRRGRKGVYHFHDAMLLQNMHLRWKGGGKESLQLSSRASGVSIHGTLAFCSSLYTYERVVRTIVHPVNRYRHFSQYLGKQDNNSACTDTKQQQGRKPIKKNLFKH